MVKLKVAFTQSGSFSMEELNDLIEKVQEANGQKDVSIVASTEILDQISNHTNMASLSSEDNDVRVKTGFFSVVNGIAMITDDKGEFAQDGEIVIMPVIKTEGVTEVVSALWEDFYIDGEG